jgi:hypothetical protein
MGENIQKKGRCNAICHHIFKRERERVGAADVIKDQEHNGKAKGEGIGMSPIGGTIYLNCQTHPQGFVLNQAAVFVKRMKVVNAHLNCKSFILISVGEYCVR